MPCDSPDSVGDFQLYLGKAHSLIEDHPSSLACILGDFTADLCGEVVGCLGDSG